MLNILFELFFVFVKIGSISFGGGYAMIPFLQYETISRGWLTEAEILNMVGISQITPGPIATNLATFVGFKQAGVIGAIISTIGVTLPSLILVILVTKYVMNKLPNHIREGIFMGLQPVVISLIFLSCISIAFEIYFPSIQSLTVSSILSNIDILPMIITVCSFIAMFKFKISPIKIIIISAIVGAIIL